MNLTNFKSIIDLLKAFPDEQSCIDYLTHWRWKGNIVSPFDADSKVYKCKLNRYRCKNTGKYFNVKTGTIFEDTKIPLVKWFLALYIFSSHKKGISSHQLAKDIQVTQKTSWFMLHRLRLAFDHPAYREQLEGHVEVDETFIGANQMWRHEKKKARSESGQVINDKIPVIGLRARGGNVMAFVLPNMIGISGYVFACVKPLSIVSTDTLRSYHVLRTQYKHVTVNHKANQFVNGIASTNGIENFWSHMKRGITGIYHHASIKHLQPYVNEFSFRFNSRNLETSERFSLILQNIARRLTYKALINEQKD